MQVNVATIMQANSHLRGKFVRLFVALRLLVTAIRYRPNVVYVNQAGATRLALSVGRILHCPVVTHVRLLEDVQYVVSLKASETALPHIICISQFIHDQFLKFPELARRTTILYDIYSLQSDADISLFEDQKECPVCISVGRIVPIKGLEILLHALAILKDQGLMSRCLFVGDFGIHHQYSAQLKQLAASLQIEAQVEWLGYRNDVLHLVSEASVLVCSSHAEPLGRVIFEAWDAGVIPVAWAGSGGAAEVINASNGGMLYPFQSGESLAQVLKQVFQMNPDQKRKLVQNGREWLMQNCSPKPYVDQMLSIWRSAVNVK